jgi:8-oxo-dGTP diphosphatase
MSDLGYTLIFLTRGADVLMLQRCKPPNQGLWNGIGGRIEMGETPRQCALREIAEETGYILTELTFGGLLTWEGFEIPTGRLYIYTAEAPLGEPHRTAEGTLGWKPRSWVFSAPEVVSNIHVFGPRVMAGEPPRRYHFIYQDGKILDYEFLPLDMNMGCVV